MGPRPNPPGPDPSSVSGDANSTGSHQDASGEGMGTVGNNGATQPNLTSGPYPFLTPPDRPGELGRLGPYRVVRLLGEGGMGFVFQAEDEGLRRTVALKVMRPLIAVSPIAKERFLAEGRAAAAVKSDHVITIFDVGEVNGAPYLEMEYLDGLNLDEWLKSWHPNDQPIPVDVVFQVAKDLLKGLMAAHEKKLIHRDIKPTNLWIENGTNRVKLLDFGLARSLDGNLNLTGPGEILGTPAYMSPEQTRGEQVDERADLFSVGVVLYRMLTGSSPFVRQNRMATLYAVVNAEVPQVKSLAAGTPDLLAGLIDSLLAKSPDNRPESAKAALAVVLKAEQQFRVGGSVPVPLPEAQPPLPETLSLASTERSLSSERVLPEEQLQDEPLTKNGNGRRIWYGTIAIGVAAAALLAATADFWWKPADGGGEQKTTGPTDNTAQAPTPPEPLELADRTKYDPTKLYTIPEAVETGRLAWVPVAGFEYRARPGPDAPPWKGGRESRFMDNAVVWQVADVAGVKYLLLTTVVDGTQPYTVEAPYGWVSASNVLAYKGNSSPSALPAQVMNQAGHLIDVEAVPQKGMIINTAASIEAFLKTLPPSLFTAPAANLAEAFNRGEFPPALRRLYAGAGVHLGDNVRVSQRLDGKGWIVTEGEKLGKDQVFAARQEYDLRLQDGEVIGREHPNMAWVYDRPQIALGNRRKSFVLANVLFIFQRRNGFALIGSQPTIESQTVEAVHGWVEEARLMFWNTAEALEWDRSTTDPQAAPSRKAEGLIFTTEKHAEDWMRFKREAEFAKDPTASAKVATLAQKSVLAREPTGPDRRTRVCRGMEMRYPLPQPQAHPQFGQPMMYSLGWFGPLVSDGPGKRMEANGIDINEQTAGGVLVCQIGYAYSHTPSGKDLVQQLRPVYLMPLPSVKKLRDVLLEITEEGRTVAKEPANLKNFMIELMKRLINAKDPKDVIGKTVAAEFRRKYGIAIKSTFLNTPVDQIVDNITDEDCERLLLIANRLNELLRDETESEWKMVSDRLPSGVRVRIAKRTEGSERPADRFYEFPGGNRTRWVWLDRELHVP